MVCLVDCIESLSIAKSLAQANNYELDATQDIRGALLEM